MATTSSRRTPIAGGKIVNSRKPQPTPYSRPYAPTSKDPPENPNWFSGLVYPAKFIASGAAKLISFFGNDEDDDSSSSSSHHASSEDEDDDEIENDMSYQDDDQLDKVLSSSNKSDNKYAIEQLVMQETYTRKEANELIKLVRSRIMHTVGSIAEGETTPDMRNTAIREARKWLQEKRSGLKQQTDSEHDVLNVASPSQISRNEKASPVDMARSYMQSRPAWASLSLKQFEVGSSSPFGMLQFREETPKSTLRSSEPKKSLFTSGSWNLLDEIRRVRSKATEEILPASPLTKTNLPSFSPESNQPQDTLMDKGVAEGADSTHDRSKNVVQGAAASDPCRVIKDNEAGQPMELQDSEEAADLEYNKNDEVKQLKSTATESDGGFASGSLAEGQVIIHETQPYEEENGNLVSLSQVEPDIDMENLNHPEEPATDIPTDTVVNGSQNNSSMQEEELSQDFSQPNAKDAPPAKPKDTQARKTRVSTRRGKGRGK